MVFSRLLHVLRRARRTSSWTELKLLLRDRLFPATPVQTNDQSPLPPVLFQMATAYWMSQAIYVAATLGIADLLADGPQTSGALAVTTRSDARSIFRLLRALSSVGVVSQVGAESFALSRLGEGLRSDVPGSLRELIITIGEIHYQAYGELLYSVRTGLPAFNEVFGSSLFDYLQQNATAAERFNRGMTNLAGMLAYAVLLAYDFSGISAIVDVGGGEGKLLRRILEFYPETRGIVFDLPNAIESRNQSLGYEERCTYMPGNFFDSVPEGDAYLLCGIVHDWDDDGAITALRNCRKAMTKNGRVLLIDMIVPDTKSASYSKLLDLNMLVMTGGRERTKSEFHSLLDAADYRVTRFIPTVAPQTIIEAVPK